MIHHRVADALHDVAVAQAARLLRHAQVAGIHEPDELRRLVIERDGRVRRIRGGLPELRDSAAAHAPRSMASPRRGIAAVAIGAAEHDVRRSVHRVRIGRRVALHAARAFPVRLLPRLVDPVARRTRRGNLIRTRGHRRAEPRAQQPFRCGIHAGVLPCARQLRDRMGARRGRRPDSRGGSRRRRQCGCDVVRHRSGKRWKLRCARGRSRRTEAFLRVQQHERQSDRDARYGDQEWRNAAHQYWSVTVRKPL